MTGSCGENLDVVARKLGEMQAKLTQFESLGEPVSGLAGIDPGDIKNQPGQGGGLIRGRLLSIECCRPHWPIMVVRPIAAPTF